MSEKATLRVLHLDDKVKVQLDRKQRKPSQAEEREGGEKVLGLSGVQHSENGEQWVWELHKWVQNWEVWSTPSRRAAATNEPPM